jgi:ribosomal protein L11 methyltransferase
MAFDNEGREWLADPPAPSPRTKMTSTATPSTHRATFAIGNEQTARRVVDLLTESFFEGQAAIAAFEGPGGRWNITVHFAEAPDQRSIRGLVGLAAGDEAALAISFDTVEAKDWVKAALEELVPVRAGRFIVHGRHDRERVPPNKLGIEIEAALAFGTGHHGTTRGCLLLLDEVLKAHSPRRVLDVGTGAGVLAIAAAKALRGKVLASDIDPLSVRVATDNARLNGAGDLVEAIVGNGFSAPQFKARGPFDLVLANILANPLRQMATPMSRHLAPLGLVILSGLLPPQASAVIAAYRARGLVLKRHIRIEGWSSLLMGKAG